MEIRNPSDRSPVSARSKQTAWPEQAVAATRKRCWQFDWVVEFDIKAAFDQIDHSLLMKAVRNHIKEGWILLYIERWLKAPFETAEGTQVPRERGTPQGGVVSPILMNLFMHYAFDAWMKRTNPACPFARYGDDAVVHCSGKQQAERVMRSIEARLAECGLTMHPEKSKVLPLSPGRVERHGFEYYRHGALSLYAALEVKTGKVQGKTAKRHTSEEFICFLSGLVNRACWAKEIHIVLDNLAAHKTKAVDQFLAQHPKVRFHFTPTYSSWLNQVGLWFAKIQRDLLARGI